MGSISLEVITSSVQEGSEDPHTTWSLQFIMSPATLRNYHVPNKALPVRGLMARVIIIAASRTAHREATCERVARSRRDHQGHVNVINTQQQSRRGNMNNVSGGLEVPRIPARALYVDL